MLLVRSAVVALIVVLFGCGSDDEQSGTALEALAAGDKIDVQLSAAAQSDRRVPVLILGRQQLLSGPGGYDAFIRRNASADRLRLRSSVAADLKRISRQQVEVMDDLRLPAEARVTPLWILNATAALLTKAEIEQAAASSAIAYLYLLPNQLPPPAATGRLAPVSPIRSNFTVQGKVAGWNLERVGAPAVWAQGITGDGIVVALIDELIALEHPDLRNNIWVNAAEVANNGLDDDRNGYIDDRHGYDFARNSPDVGRPGGPHGTWVAGIIAGDGTGGTVTGVAPRARLMPLGGIGFLEVALAFQYAIENGADVVNMSFSIPDQRQLRGAWRMAADHAVAAGLVLVTGAGNFQQTAFIPVQQRAPEDIPSVISVGGVDAALQLVPFSSLGPVEWGSIRFFGDHALPAGLIKPDLAAFPGAGYALLNQDGGYIDPNLTTRGNSFSSPHVAGAAALLLSARPGTPTWRIAELLQATARDLEPAGKDNRTGAGLIDIPAALQRLR